MIQVRQATLSDKPNLFKFVQVAYPERYKFKIPQRWQWQFQYNPFHEQDSLPIWLAFDQDRIIGQTAAMIEPLKLGDQSVNVGWSVDTIVLPEYRRQGIGQQLQAANQAAHDVFMSLKMSPENARIKQRLGGFTLPEVHQMQLRLTVDRDDVTDRLERTSPAMATAAAATGASTVAAFVYSAQSKTRWQRIAESTERTLDITEVNHFGNEIVPLWEEFSQHYDICIRREPRYLNWKFSDQPHMEHRRFIAKQGNEVVGYTVIRKCQDPEPNTGLIVDLVANPDDRKTIAELTIHAVTYLQQSGVDTVQLATSDDRFREVYEALSFQTYRTRTPICHLSPDACHLIPDTRRLISFTYFSLGDHDLDQFPLAK